MSPAHGTRAAIRAHERAGERVTDCQPCRLYRNMLARWYYANRKPSTSPTTQNKPPTVD